MNSLTSQGVVDRITAELAERRHNTMHRKAAYIALARAILSDETAEMPRTLSFERYPAAFSQAQAA